MPRELSFLEEWPLDRLEALYRVAKSTPFFKHPKDMMALRDLLGPAPGVHRGFAAGVEARSLMEISSS